MAFGLALGLVAAAAWGAEDLFGTYISRRLGALMTTVATSVFATLALAVLLIAIRPDTPIEPGAVVKLLVIGIPVGVSYFAIFYALKLGPVAIVSPMMATYGVCAVALAVIFLGEHPHPLQMAMVPVAGLGTMLCAIVLDKGSWRPKAAGKGPLVAVAVVLLSAVVTVAMKEPLSRTDWLVAVFTLRLSATALAVAVGIAIWMSRRGGTRSERAPGEPEAQKSAPIRISRVIVAVLVIVGLFDIVGLAAFTRGLHDGAAWIVALAASTSPVLVVMGATLLFRERPRGSQWVGVALVTISLVVISVG